jgi:hypothetical protein
MARIIRHHDITPAERERRVERAAWRQRWITDIREIGWCAVYALGGAAVVLLVQRLSGAL